MTEYPCHMDDRGWLVCEECGAGTTPGPIPLDVHLTTCPYRKTIEARRRKARVADRRHADRHMVDPDYLRDRR